MPFTLTFKTTDPFWYEEAKQVYFYDDITSNLIEEVNNL